MQDELFIYRRNALINNLCKEWDLKWKACKEDKEALVRLVLKQQSLPHFLTYCHKGMGLSKEYILDNFKDFINGNYIGIDVDGVVGDYKSELYVGYNGNLSVADDVLALQWCNIPSLEIKPTKAVKLYVSNKSSVHIRCGGYNSLVVMLFDSSILYLDDVDRESTVTIYRYDKKARVEVGSSCNSLKVRIFDKALRL